MTNGSTLSLPDIEDRIAILRDNLRQLTEQAAALSGAADEARAADRIAAQQAELDQLIAQRDEMLANRAAAAPMPAAPKAKRASKKPRAAARKKAAKKKGAKTKKKAGKKPARKKPAVKKKKKSR
jgi:hypothetical protein